VVVGPTFRRRRLGAVLRKLREGSSFKLEEVAIHLGVAPSTLSRIETGKAPTRSSYLAVMLELYGVDDPVERQLLADLAREGQRKGWWAHYDDVLPAGSGTYLGLEAEASALATFQAQVLPGLLQTADYARATIRAARPDLTAEQAERLVAVQRRRQEVLLGSDPLRLRAVIDESVLLRSVGTRPVMKRQLERLLAAAAEPSLTVQVLPLSGGKQPVLSGSFGILSFAEPTDADVVCAEGISGDVLITERGSQVHAVRARFDALSSVALSADESAALIRDHA